MLQTAAAGNIPHMPPPVGLFARGAANVFARRPAVSMALALIGGIIAEPLMPTWLLAWMIGLAGLIAAAVFAFRRQIVCSLLLLAALFLGGLTAAQLDSFYFPSGHIAAFTAEESRFAQLELRITSPPRVQSAMPQTRPLPPKQTAHATVLRVMTQTGWQDAGGDIALTIDQPHPSLAIGQHIRVIGMLQRPPPAMNPGQFDYAAFHRRQRVLAMMNVPHADAVEVLTEPTFAPLESLREKSRRLLASGFATNQSHDQATLRALVLGDRDPEMRDVQDDFSHSGAAHLLAVSGLHIVLIAGFTLLVCRLLRLRPRTATWIMMLIVLLYGLVVLPAAPALRATVLCLAYGISRLMRRSRDGIQTLALCAAGLLLYSPHDLYGAGFQLSFLTVLGMLICGGRLIEWSHSLFDSKDARVARSFQPLEFWGALRLRTRAHLAASLAISMIAWLVSMPLVMYHFNQVNPWAVFAGLLLLPVVALGLILGLLKIMLTLLLPGLAHAWAAMAATPMIWMRHEVNWLAHLPCADLPMSPPPVWGIVLYYALLCLPLLPWTMPSLKRWIRCAPAAACLLAMLPLLLAASPSQSGGETRVTLLAIGAGQIGVIELPDRRVVLIDDGSLSMTDPLRSCLAPYLRSRGCRQVQTIFLSHPDFDHISATAATADEFHAARVYISRVFREQAKNSQPAQAMLNHLEQAHVPIKILSSRDQKVPLDADTSLDVLWPPDGREFTSTNNAGIVLRLNCHDRCILFPADIQAPTERELIDQHAPLHAEVLVAPHHGSAELTTSQFVHAVDPQFILSSNDRRLSRKQRTFDQIVADRPLYRTSRCGAITVHISKTGGLRVETFLKPAPQRSDH